MRQHRYPSDLTDREWVILQPPLPSEYGPGPLTDRPRPTGRSEGIFYITRGGCAWRMMPTDLQHWSIENFDFLVRDQTFAKDRSRARSKVAFSLAGLRSFALNCLRHWHISNLTAATEHFAAKPFELLDNSGLT